MELLDIYPAREKPIPGVTSQLVLDNISVKSRLVSKEKVLDEMSGEPQEGIIMTVGAGDIDRLIPEIKTRLLKAG